MPQFLLYNGIFHYLTNSKHWKTCFAQARELAERTENVTALAVIKKAIDYYQNNDDKDLYLWATRIIYSEKKTTDALYVIPKVEIPKVENTNWTVLYHSAYWSYLFIHIYLKLRIHK